MIQKQITVREDQLKWLVENHICLSKLVRSYIDDAMRTYKDALRIMEGEKEKRGVMCDAR